MKEAISMGLFFHNRKNVNPKAVPKAVTQAKDDAEAKIYFQCLHEMQRFEKIARATKDYSHYFAAGEKCLLYVGWMKRDLVPPSIPCIQDLPDTYCACNRWNDATRVYGIAYAEKLINKQELNEQIKFVRLIETAHNVAIALLKNEPGFLQRNIYKKLNEVDQDALKFVMRRSIDIEKVKSGNTYELHTN